jgi:DNA-directed RNA polymerase subunit RPC12/RpoP
MSDYGRCVICGQSLSQIEELEGICDDCRVSIIYAEGLSPDIEDYAS